MRRRQSPSLLPCSVLLLCVLACVGTSGAAGRQQQREVPEQRRELPEQQDQQEPGEQQSRLGSRSVPHTQPGCSPMWGPGEACYRRSGQRVNGCCVPNHVCRKDRASATGHSCQPVQQPQQLAYTHEQAATAGGCSMRVGLGEQCGGTGGRCTRYSTCSQLGQWLGFCCPDGFSCAPNATGPQRFRVWTCQLNVQERPPLLDAAAEVLAYPPRAMPARACTCRHAFNGSRVPMECPSPWSSPAGTTLVPPALRVDQRGMLAEAGSRKPVVLRGINWFGHHVGSFNFDGLYAYCDDNATDSDPPCVQDGDIPPWSFPSAAIGGPAQQRLALSFWGKRRMTNDFAAVVWRIKLLGFNAVRVQFVFSDLNLDIPQAKNGDPEFFPCLLDSDEYIAGVKTLDPLLMQGLGQEAASLKALRPFLPRFKGMQHPPPKTGDAQCDLPWSAPFLPTYTGGRGKRLRLTQCNWYLPTGPGMPAIYRFVWQVQYLVSQGLYVLLDFSSTREVEPNVADPALLAANWKALWRTLADLPRYATHLRGRVFADLVNEPSRWGCQWSTPCATLNGTLSCAPMLEGYGMAAAAIAEVDPEAPIFLNGLGQDFSPKWRHCGSAFPGQHWGDGFITNRQAVRKWNLSNPSDLFSRAQTSWVGRAVRVQERAPDPPRFVLSPHIYPSSVTGSLAELNAALETITHRWDLSWGWKMRGVDATAQGAPLGRMPVVIGESGAKDSGDNTINNTDTTVYLPADLEWLQVVASYLRGLSDSVGHQPSYFWWAWNANSGDTKGIVGPRTTWREVQWGKVRVLIRSYGLRPWYCGWWPDFCDAVDYSN